MVELGRSARSSKHQIACRRKTTRTDHLPTTLYTTDIFMFWSVRIRITLLNINIEYSLQYPILSSFAMNIAPKYWRCQISLVSRIRERARCCLNKDVVQGEHLQYFPEVDIGAARSLSPGYEKKCWPSHYHSQKFCKCKIQPEKMSDMRHWFITMVGDLWSSMQGSDSCHQISSLLSVTWSGISTEHYPYQLYKIPWFRVQFNGSRRLPRESRYHAVSLVTSTNFLQHVTLAFTCLLEWVSDSGM